MGNKKNKRKEPGTSKPPGRPRKAQKPPSGQPIVANENYKIKTTYYKSDQKREHRGYVRQHELTPWQKVLISREEIENHWLDEKGKINTKIRIV